MSKIEVNTIDVQCGSTLTVGSSGKTVSLATGASQTGFGRTGTVDWCTTAKTSPFTAVSGDGFFLNTNGGAITVTLPSSPSQGDIVAFKDYNNTWDDACKAVTLCRNGSKIGGECENAILNTEAQSVTLIYVDGTKGWMDIHDSTANVTGNPAFISATGGTITTSGDFKIHTFTGDGNFVVTQGSSAPNNNVSYMVVAGGGGGGSGGSPSGGNGAGGGGGGGFREGQTPQAPFTGSPLKAGSGVPVSTQSYPITVGGGGAGGVPTPGPPYASVNGVKGDNSVFSTITSTGGGFGGHGANAPGQGGPGGSGGGAGGGCSSANPGGTGNDPPTTPAQGTNGGDGGNTSPDVKSGGGGGATAAGTSGSNPPSGNGPGGAGATTSISGSPLSFSGGGGGGAGNPSGASFGGSGGTGGGGAGFGNGTGDGVAGTVNTGGGGGGAGTQPGTANGGAGGSGKVVIKYKFQ
tara:strand:- start:4079 stop:5467 length:1389 start_codon:yes stop_codon:yes gene_type:complete